MLDLELGDDTVQRFVAELKSYTLVVLPTLLVYATESRASLKLWHAVRQLPYLEKESDVAPDNLESQFSINVAQVNETRVKREATKKEARRIWIQNFVFSLLLVVIALFDHFVTLSGWLNRSRDGEEFDGYTSSADGEGEFDGQSGVGYGWYYNSTLGQIDWAKSYYLITMFLPALFLLARASYLLSGLNDRAVLRDAKGNPFMVPIRGNRYTPHRPALLHTVIILVSTLLATGALWFHNTICVAILFGSMVHFVISNVIPGKMISFKAMLIGSIVLLFILAMLVYSLISTDMPLPFRIFKFGPHVGDTNWAGLILSALVCTGSFQFMAMCYRMDYAFSYGEDGEGEIVRTEDVKVAIRGSSGDVEVDGRRISYLRSSCTRRCPRLHYPKPYFHASLLSWFSVYVLVALLSALGYIECEPEMVGVYALYLAPPGMAFGVLGCAVLRGVRGGSGELRKVWAYKEEWVRDSKSESKGQGKAEDEGKVLVEGGESEKVGA